MIKSRDKIRKIVFLSVIATCLDGCFLLNIRDLKLEQRALELIDQAVVLMRQGNLDKAEAAFQVSRELVSLPASLDGLGCIAFFRGENLIAEDFFKQALDLDFRYTEAVGNLALLYEQMGKPQKAEEYFKRAIELNPANYRIRNNYAIFLAQRDNSPRQLAREQLAKASVLVETPIIEENMLELSKRGE
jgi:Flp pilus assembly protein TadD